MILIFAIKVEPTVDEYIMSRRRHIWSHPLFFLYSAPPLRYLSEDDSRAKPPLKLLPKTVQ